MALAGVLHVTMYVLGYNCFLTFNKEFIVWFVFTCQQRSTPGVWGLALSQGYGCWVAGSVWKDWKWSGVVAWWYNWMRIYNVRLIWLCLALLKYGPLF